MNARTKKRILDALEDRQEYMGDAYDQAKEENRRGMFPAYTADDMRRRRDKIKSGERLIEAVGKL